jgi:Dyp-type peroxidase family
MTSAASPAESVEWSEVQRVILRGYANLTCSHFFLLRIERAADAGTWLGRLLDEEVVRFDWGHRGDTGPALGLGVTREGLAALGVDLDTIDGFSPGFVDGMTALGRPRKFGDTGSSGPDQWLWGQGTGTPHLLVMVYAASEDVLAQAVASYRSGFHAAGVLELYTPDGGQLGSCRALAERREHFGFADGISQPRFRNEPSGVRSRGVHDADRIATGELLLGYKNEAGILPPSPFLSAAARARAEFSRADGDLGKNGSYLVYRQLEQDVGGFWRAMGTATKNATLEERVHLASKIVGRAPNGDPLVTRPEGVAHGASDAENFDFAHDDPRGTKCPLGAHIRRSNPRATLARDPDIGLAKSKKHRILRRGRSYGEPFVEGMVPEELVRAADAGTGHPGPRGLHFICFNADIANQFEFVQQTWMNGTVFQGLRGEVDPLVGNPSGTGGLFTIPGEPLRCRVHDLPRFVTVRGGAYFFAPSRAALRYLSRLG